MSRRLIVSVTFVTSLSLACLVASMITAPPSGASVPVAKTVAGYALAPIGVSTSAQARARIDAPTTVAWHSSGRGFFITNSFRNTIDLIFPGHPRRVLVGSRPRCVVGSNKAWDACLSIPHGVTNDGHGGLIITDTFHNRILKYSHGRIRTLVGNGQLCDEGMSAQECGEGGDPLRARLGWPTIARLYHGGVLISDARSHRILLARGGRIRRLAGTGRRGFSGDYGPADQADLNAPADAIPYRDGLMISDGNNCRLRWRSPKGIIYPFAGYGLSIAACKKGYEDSPELYSWGGPIEHVPENAPAIKSKIHVSGFMAADSQNLYVTDFLNNRVRMINNKGRICTLLGTGQPGGSNGEFSRPARSFRLYWPSGVALRGHRLLVTDAGQDRIIRVSWKTTPTCH